MTAASIVVPAQVTGFIGDPRVLFVVSHSGGKDSQAMMIDVLAHVPASQMLVAHASLGNIEWPGALELAREQAQAAGVPFIVAKAVFLDGRPKSFLDKLKHQWDRRQDAPPFPSVNNRWCTGELKTQPIEREVRRYAKAHGYTTVVMCVGLRAQESEDRRAKVPFEHKPKKSCQGRAWFEWLPIHALSTLDVFQTIEAAGQQPHWAYAQGNERLSCKFCIYGSKGDLAHAAKKDPALFAEYVRWEEITGYTLHMDRVPLAELVAQAQAQATQEAA
jgi:3'-phosphoadenosine 5'-phosphosulfate sulfotransferase (PAPS reductase)/FAD synthetase